MCFNDWQSSQSEPDLSDEEADCPPGFELPSITSTVHTLSPSVSSCFSNREESYGRNLPSSDQIYMDVESILVGVEHDLHSSAMGSLTQYFESIVGEEVKKIIGSPKDDQLNEVTSHTSLYKYVYFHKIPSYGNITKFKYSNYEIIKYCVFLGRSQPTYSTTPYNKFEWFFRGAS